LSTVYNNCSEKLEYICQKEHKHNISWDSFKQGHGCPYCAGQGKPTIEFIKKEFAKEGYILVTNYYINSDQQLNYICKKGHQHSMKWNNWRIGRRCPSCKAINSSKRMSGENHYNWKGGVTNFNKEIRNFIKSIAWGDKVFKIDDYTCQMCGIRGGELESHHIIPLSSIKAKYNIINIEDVKECDILYDVTNGITMCKKCHKLYHKKLKEGDLELWMRDLMVK